MNAASLPYSAARPLRAAEIEEGRCYNATLRRIIRHADDLTTIQVVLDEPPGAFVAGQYTLLGLGEWEPTVGGGSAMVEASPFSAPRLVQRAYSLTSSLVDDHGELLDWRSAGWWEFLIVRIDAGPEAYPTLTPRLFALKEGSRLFVHPRPMGRYTTERIRPDSNVVFLATGTGQAPHSLMIEDLLSRGHRGKILHVVCTRRRCDLVHAAGHAALMTRYPNYRYIGRTMRETEDLDPQAGDYVAARHLQHLWLGDEIERFAGVPLGPEDAHLFLCGNPAMIAGNEEEKGLLSILVTQGWTLDLARAQGNVHLETYW